MIPAPAIDGRRADRFVEQLRRFAPHYTPELDLADPGNVGVALLRIFAHLAEIVAVRLDKAPDKNFVAFLDALGIVLLPARTATAAVTFRLASGLESTVTVPAGTRVTAHGRDGVIPFETTGDLVAIPGGIAQIYGVDPARDVIFRPPPDFPTAAIRPNTDLIYIVQAFAAAGARRLQLDHVTDLKEGSFVRIDCRDKRVVSKVDTGNIVTFDFPLSGDVAVGSRVTLVRDFDVFDGIDLQEHVLYLGHADILTVKEPAEITLSVRLKTPGAAPVSPLRPVRVVWQFWTQKDPPGPGDEAHWEPLATTADGTAGLAASGAIVLAKPGGLEIKPRPVNGITSRWIRGVLQDKLPAGTGVLPEIDSLTIAVKSGTAEGIPADQGFYNATPLDVQVAESVGFLPFGTEPRQFDQFYLASREAFSKKDAAVTLHFVLDLQTLASPSLAAITTGARRELRAYSIGLRRRLFELSLAGRTWKILGDPSAIDVGGARKGVRFIPSARSAPSAIVDDTATRVYVVVKTEDASGAHPLATRLWVFYQDANPANARWIDLGTPVDSGPMPFNPVAIRLPAGGFAQVFVVGTDGKLYSQILSDAPGGSGVWRLHDLNGVAFGSSPFVTVEASTKSVLVYVTARNGIVYEFRPGDGHWRPLTPTPDDFFAFSRPFAEAFAASGRADAKVFVVGYITHADKSRTWQLRECNTAESGTPPFMWVDLGLPSTVPAGFDARLDADPDGCAPVGYVEQPAAPMFKAEGKHVFLSGPDGLLYERLDDPFGWVPRSRAGDPGLVGCPSALVDRQTESASIHLASASNRNSLVRWDLEIATGTFPTKPTKRIIPLSNGLPTTERGPYNGTHVDVTHPTLPSQLSPIHSSDKATRLVCTDDTLVPLPTPNSTVRILKSTGVTGTAPAGNDVTLRGATAAIVGKILDMQGERRLVVDFDTGTSIAKLDPDPAPLAAKTPYEVYELVHGATAREGARRGVVLHDRVTDAPNVAADYLQIDGDAVLHRIESYSRTAGVALLAAEAPASVLANARSTLAFQVTGVATEIGSPEETGVVPKLSWEYWNGRGWLSLAIAVDDTRDLLKDGAITFDVPSSIAATEVAGQDNLWVRARLVGGDYGHETFRMLDDKTIVSEKSTLRPPKVRQLRITYTASPAPLDACLTFNNLDYLNQTAASRLSGAQFRPFVPLEDQALTVAIGFDRSFRAGPIRLLVDAAEREIDPVNPPVLAWSFRKDHEWHELAAEDGSLAFTRQGILKLSASDPLTRETRFGASSYWIKGSLVARTPAPPYPRPRLRGLFVNTVEAIQGETIFDEIVGSSSSEAGQTLQLQHVGVLQDEDIRLRETLSVEERDTLERLQGKASVIERQDIGGLWVRWRERPLFDCGPDDRCYALDRATGTLRFGDGVHGRIPPADVDNIRAFRYRAGGGAFGNVPAGGITTLGSSVEGIESVFNPTPAGGGSDAADTTTMLTIGPREISHRDRAVSPEDFEELALEASREVAKARCLAVTNLARRGPGRSDPCDPAQRHDARGARGRVSLIIVPRSHDPQPCPSLALRRTVGDYLRDRAPSLVTAGDRLVVRPPDYVVVSVVVDVFVTSLEHAARVEQRVLDRLQTFLHPVDGGPDRSGWDFGRSIARSDVFAELERIEEVDRAENLEFHVGTRTSTETVAVGPNELLAGGIHKVRLRKA